MMTFTAIPNEVMGMNISDGAFRLYSLLQSYCYGAKKVCFPSQKTLAERLRKSVRTIQRYINELVEINLIKVIRKGSNNNHYEILNKVVQKVSEVVSKTVKTIKEKCESYKKEKKDNFNNYEQRNYDMNKLESLFLSANSNISYEECLISR